MRILRAGIGPARSFTRLSGIAAALSFAAVPFAASAAPAATAAAAAAAVAVPGQGVDDFYRARGNRPLWLAPGSEAAAEQLVMLLSTARLDGLDPGRYRLRQVAKALRSARRGDRRAIDRAERLLSQAFVAYASDLRKAPNIGIKYVDRELVPGAPWQRLLLDEAAAAPSLETYIGDFGWMHPFYGDLRTALEQRRYDSEQERRLLALNLERARTLPAGRHRYVVVNSAAQRLYMYDNGEVVDSMRVVVGKQQQPTPLMAAFIRYTSLNPYWNVPPDLAAERVAPYVLKDGIGYLRTAGYQVLSDWGDDPSVVDPKTIDWQAVADGRIQVRIRQLPGPGNAMGRMKFMFPNDEGIYLHDTPDKEKLEEASRLFSGGCVRLEDAPRFARWLYGKPLKPQGARPEQKVPAPELVPVYLTYLTAVPSGSDVAFFDDIYGRDAARLAQLAGGAALASR